MSERAEVSFDAALMMALRADAQKELDELPSPAQLKERYPDTSRWDARLQAALHKHRPVLKRVLITILTLIILTLGALAVSADFRRAVYTMIQKFLPIEMQLTYQVDGEPLEQLPNGYSDHYVPDGFERDREQEFERAENFLHVYSSKESGKGYTVRCSIIQPGQQSSFDNEHTTYENIKVGDLHPGFIIIHQQRTVNDGADVLAVVVPVIRHQFPGNIRKLLADTLSADAVGGGEHF